MYILYSSSVSSQAGSGAHSASYPLGVGSCYPGGKAAGA